MPHKLVGTWSDWHKVIEFNDTEDFFEEGADDEHFIGFASGFWWAMLAMGDGVPMVCMYDGAGKLLVEITKGSWGGPDVAYLD